MSALLWWARVWIDEKGLKHTLICDCVTEKTTEEWHPIEGDYEKLSEH